MQRSVALAASSRIVSVVQLVSIGCTPSYSYVCTEWCTLLARTLLTCMLTTALCNAFTLHTALVSQGMLLTTFDN
jgi:hypothetical protein